jgi:hypothetical protein
MGESEIGWEESLDGRWFFDHWEDRADVEWSSPWQLTRGAICPEHIFFGVYVVYRRRDGRVLWVGQARKRTVAARLRYHDVFRNADRRDRPMMVTCAKAPVRQGRAA